MTDLTRVPMVAVPMFVFAVLCVGCGEATGSVDAGAQGDAAAQDASTTGDAALGSDAALDLDAAIADAGIDDAAVTMNDAASASDAAASDAATPDAASRAALSLTVTVHLENHPPYDATWASGLRTFAAAFERHGARLTLEPRPEVLMSGTIEARTALADLEAAGHSVGSHAATGTMPGLTLSAFTSVLTTDRTQLAAVVSRVDHVSGVCSTLDFVGASAAAGFTFTTGATALCITAMAPADRPAGYETLSCASATDPRCHTSYPTDVAARIHPWRARDGAHWLTDDPTGRLVVFPGSGTLPCLEEESHATTSLPTCTLTSADRTLAASDLAAAIASVDPARVNAFYWVWGNFDPAHVDYTVLDAILGDIDAHVAAGEVRWTTGTEMYDDYLAWEATHR
jgi:hypothetical protein